MNSYEIGRQEQLTHDQVKMDLLGVEIDQLKSRIDELEDALTPFAALAEQADKFRHEDNSTCEWRLKASDIRKAKELLKDK